MFSPLIQFSAFIKDSIYGHNEPGLNIPTITHSKSSSFQITHKEKYWILIWCSVLGFGYLTYITGRRMGRIDRSRFFENLSRNISKWPLVRGYKATLLHNLAAITSHHVLNLYTQLYEALENAPVEDKVKINSLQKKIITESYFIIALQDLSGHYIAIAGIRPQLNMRGDWLLDLQHLVIDQKIRGQGLGKALMDTLKRELGSAGFKWINLTLSGNSFIRNAKFYTEQGFILDSYRGGIKTRLTGNTEVTLPTQIAAIETNINGLKALLGSLGPKP